MHFHNGMIEAIGNTPMIKLKKASAETNCNILGKAEFMNPGQSVKDRAALYIIRDAEARGNLRPGGTIVEGTAVLLARSALFHLRFSRRSWARVWSRIFFSLGTSEVWTYRNHCGVEGLAAGFFPGIE